MLAPPLSQDYTNLMEDGMDSTIFALSTAPGKAGVAIIRISGENAGKALQALTGKPLPKPRMAVLAKLFKPETSIMIDEAITLWFPAPASFTGEDIVELHTHGGHAVIQTLFQTLSTIKNVRFSEPGEFARRAFANGKIDLTQAEGLADLIDAETEMQQHQALQQMQGMLKQQCGLWRKQLLGILAKIEAYIDFPDEDLPPKLRGDFLKHAGMLCRELKRHLAERSGERIREGVHIAILGAPNAGKSTLLNMLAKRDIAITSNIPGTTRDVLEAHLNIGGYAVTLYDTAGLRETGDLVESEGVRRARDRAEKADIRVCLFDSENLPDLDPATLALANHSAIAVLSRSDLKRKEIPLPATISGKTPVILSTKEGVDVFVTQLEKRIKSCIGKNREGALVTRERHRMALIRCAERMEAFLVSIKANKPIELCAEEVRQASHALGEITGHIAAEEVLGEIFSRFCIGK